MRRFYHDDLDQDIKNIVVSGKEANHIKNVLRLKQGEKVIFTNGKGFDFIASLDSFENRVINFSILEKVKGEKESPVNITIAFSLLKGKKNDEIIKPVTETGVTGLIPFMSTRTVSEPEKKKKESKVKRWREISKEAIKQCERSKLPAIKDIIPFNELIKNSEQYDLKILFYERSKIDLKNISNTEKPKNILALIGPEGGFTDEEIKLALENGFKMAGLGPRILRAETAIVCSSFLCQHLFGDII